METVLKEKNESRGAAHKRRERLLGRSAITGEERLKNNDPLAPVILLIQEGDTPQTVKRISEEYYGDMSERGKIGETALPFHAPLNWYYNGNDFIEPGGQSMREMYEKGLSAAKSDQAIDERLSYQLKRSEIQAMHVEKLLGWYYSDEQNCLRIVSMCPEEWELPAETAKLSAFKTDRLMACVWIFEKTKGGVSMQAFSLDYLTLENFKENNIRLGVEAEVQPSTLEQLAQADVMPIADGLEAATAMRLTHDQILDEQEGGSHYYGTRNNHQRQESYQMVLAKPEAQQLHLSAVREIANSLVSETTTPGLATIIKELRKPYSELEIPTELQINWQRPITPKQSSDLMEYLRSRALPHYIFSTQEQGDGGPATVAHGFDSEGSGYASVASAGAQAVSSGVSYEGACPSSPQASIGANSEVAGAMQAYGANKRIQKIERKDWVWKKGFCIVDNCEDKNKIVQVGPCSVCEKCQTVFDEGENQPGFWDTLFHGLNEALRVEGGEVIDEANNEVKKQSAMARENSIADEESQSRSL